MADRVQLVFISFDKFGLVSLLSRVARVVSIKKIFNIHSFRLGLYRGLICLLWETKKLLYTK